MLFRSRSISGFDVVFGGDLPRGAGLSSSAAVECGMAVTLCHLFGIEIDRMQLAKLCLQAEHEFAGVKCGLLDQFSSLFGKAGFVMSINFKTLNYRYIPLNMDGFSVLMFNTNKPHTLAEGNEFNKRVASCRQGVEALQQHIVNIDCLCDASPGQLNEVKANLDEVSFDRCTYIVEENIRYHQALKALEENNMVLFGKLLFDTHNGLKSLYGISCKELDLLIDYAKGNSNILGAKLMGGGYGGCTINIVKSDSVDQISREVTELYNNASPYRLQVYNVRSADGAEILKSET